MSNIVNIHDAEKRLSRIVDEVAAGAEVIVAKAGQPVAGLTPIVASPKPKRLGLLKGKIEVSDDFNAPIDDEVVVAFEGR